MADQKVTVGASSAASSAFNALTRLLILTSDVACQFSFAASPTASATTGYLPADTPRSFGVVGGEKVAVITQQ